MIPQLDLTADIVPAQGLGGFEVGKPVSGYQEILRTLGHPADRSQGVVPRVHGLWQVVYRMPQLYEPTDGEWHAFFDASAEFRRRSQAGLEADLGEVLVPVTPPDSRPAVELWVDVRDGIVDAVVALKGYEGRFRELRAGMTYGEARAAEPQLREAAFLDETRVEGVDGLVLWFEPPDPEEDPEVRERAILEGVVVFDPSRTDDGIKPH